MKFYEIKARLEYPNTQICPKNIMDLKTQRYINLLDFSNWNPTLGGIFKRDYFRDVSDLQKNETVQYLEDILDSHIKQLYPKTRKLRQFIIDENRISLNRIKPAQGYTLFDKLKIFLKR